MPYEEDEDKVFAEGLLEGVVDTANTIRDTEHVIVEVGLSKSPMSESTA